MPYILYKARSLQSSVVGHFDHAHYRWRTKPFFDWQPAAQTRSHVVASLFATTEQSLYGQLANRDEWLGRYARHRLIKQPTVGELPSEMGAMTELFSLSIQNNILDGPLPTTTGNLFKLRRVSLANNRLSSRPTEIALLQYLVILDLRDNA